MVALSGCDAARTHPAITGPEETAAATQRLRELPGMETEFTAMRAVAVELGAVAAELVPGVSFEWSRSDSLDSRQCPAPYDQTGGQTIGLEPYRSTDPVAVSDEVWQQFTRRAGTVVSRVGATPSDPAPDPRASSQSFGSAETGTTISVSRGSVISIDAHIGCRLSQADLTGAAQPDDPTGPEETAAAEQRLLERRDLESELAEMRSAVEEIGAAADGFLHAEKFAWEPGNSYQPKPCQRPYDQTQGTALELEEYKVDVVFRSDIPDAGWQQVTDRAHDVAARFGAALPAISVMPGNYFQNFVNDEDGARLTVRKDQNTVTISARTGCRLAHDPHLRSSELSPTAAPIPYATPVPPPATPTGQPR
ncbi:LppA family lipoprotein [Nocardia sp. SSK8]|uniref:LppA family lipoprotein n=1 Tax=Nocardia sp. SSK8 TaxID=3120154 RepID=UPI00300A738E